MTPKLTLPDLSIILDIQKFSPILLTPEFLRYSNLIPGDWQLAREPVVNANLSQIAFTNGISFSSQPGSIIFSETWQDKSLEQAQIPALTHKYVEIMPEADYLGIEFNPGVFLTFESPDENVARNYIVSNLLAPHLRNSSLNATLHLYYTLERRKMYLSVREAKLELPNQSLQPAIFLSGHFRYQINGDNPLEKRQHLHHLIDNWSEDLESYTKIVNQLIST